MFAAFSLRQGIAYSTAKMEETMKRVFLICTLAVAATQLATAGQAQETVKIGVINPYSGQFADTAAQMDNGINLYIKEHGDTVAGKKIELIRRDTGGVAPDVAKRLAQELVVRDHADILTGFDLTPNALAAGDVSAEAKKFMVIMNAATSIITTKSPYIARASQASPQVNYTLGVWAAKQGIKRMYTMVSDYGPGTDAETWFTNGFKEAGGQIVGSVRFPVANPDFSAFVQRAKDENPDGIYVFVPGGVQPAAVGKALAERGIDASKTRVLGQDALADDTTIKSLGELAIGLTTGTIYNYNHESALNRKFVTAYMADYKRPPDTFSIGGYDGMHLIYEALKKTGGNTDGDALIAAAKGMTWESPRGPILIDPETRDIIQTVYLGRVAKVGDVIRYVEFDKVENVKDPAKERMKK
jgi:branched-chain amino acid transport system substrate-binding protein